MFKVFNTSEETTNGSSYAEKVSTILDDKFINNTMYHVSELLGRDKIQEIEKKVNIMMMKQLENDDASFGEAYIFALAMVAHGLDLLDYLKQDCNEELKKRGL